MNDALGPVHPGDGEPPVMHVRSIIIRPRTALGKIALSVALVGAGMLLFTVGVAIAFSLVAIAAVVGAGVLGYRALARGTRPPAPPDQRLDPAREIFLPRAQD